MKTTCTLIGLVVASLSLVALAQKPEPAPQAFERSSKSAAEADAHDPFDPDIHAPKLVQVQVEYIRLSHPALTKLLFQSKSKSADAGTLRESLQKMVLKDEADVMETQIVICRSGDKATVESIHEFIYPTEYEPSDLKAKAEEILKQSMSSAFPSNPATPTAFETRNVGSTLEVEPTLGENDTLIELRLSPELIWHTGETTWHEGKDSAGNNFKVQMPNFYTLRLQTALTCIKDQYSLVGVLSPKGEDGNPDMTLKVMLFVKCNVLTVK